MPHMRPLGIQGYTYSGSLHKHVLLPKYELTRVGFKLLVLNLKVGKRGEAKPVKLLLLLLLKLPAS